MSITNSEVVENIRKRPPFFVVLSVFSILSSSIVVIICMAGIFYSSRVYEIMNEYTSGYGYLGRNLIIIVSFFLLLLFGFKLWGNIFMLMGKKRGIIMYLIPTGILMTLNVIMLFATYFPFLAFFLLFSVLLVILYGRYFKYMK